MTRRDIDTSDSRDLTTSSAFQSQLHDLYEGYRLTRAEDQVASRINLPQLVVNQFSDIDSDSNGKIGTGELRNALNSDDAMTRLAARYTLRNLDDIDDNHFDLSDTVEWFRQDLSINEVSAWADDHGSDVGAGVGDLAARSISDHGRDDHDETFESDYDRDNFSSRSRSQLINVLEDSDATQTEKFKAIEELGRRGVTSITLSDDRGNEVHARIQVEPVSPGSDRNYVHLFAEGDDGREHILLRAISNNGYYQHETDSQGRELGYVGDWWTRTNGDSSFNGQAICRPADLRELNMDDYAEPFYF